MIGMSTAWADLVMVSSGSAWPQGMPRDHHRAKPHYHRACSGYHRAGPVYNLVTTWSGMVSRGVLVHSMYWEDKLPRGQIGLSGVLDILWESFRNSWVPFSSMHGAAVAFEVLCHTIAQKNLWVSTDMPCGDLLESLWLWSQFFQN